MGLGFLGAGNMGEAMIRGVLAAKLYPPKRIVVFDAAPGRGESLRERYGVSFVSSAGDLLKADLLNLEVHRSEADENLILARHALNLTNRALLNLLGLEDASPEELRRIRNALRWAPAPGTGARRLRSRGGNLP